MSATFREQEHAARIAEIHRGHRQWEERERKLIEQRAADDAARTRQAVERQQRQQESEQARQRVWSERAHLLQGQIAMLSAGIAEANDRALRALDSGDVAGVGLAAATRLGLEAVRDRVQSDLNNHNRYP
jgi:CHAT domain-containing protein